MRTIAEFNPAHLLRRGLSRAFEHKGQPPIIIHSASRSPFDLEADMSNNKNIHDWAQQALDKYNGSYSASDINLNATDYLYHIRDVGNEDDDLAIASHYLHCRYMSSAIFLPGAIVGLIAALGYDGAVKYVDDFIKGHWNKELVHKFGQARTSHASLNMLLWDLQGLWDGTCDFALKWGNTSLAASYSPIFDVTN